jgi:Arginine methyltransferase oligomerization subdomain/Ribosomal protein L11 methyltransferase (PrmA)
MYRVSSYGKMIADGPRIDAYVSALRQAVKPGSVVVDLGSGPGLFALIACQLGARRVFAIEPDNVIQVARDAAREYGFVDRIDFIQDFSTKVNLSENADVIVSDLRGVLPWFQQHLPSIQDARLRFLAADGILIPRRDTLWAAVVEVSQQYADIVTPWEDNRHGFFFKSARNMVTNSWGKLQVKPENLLGQPVCWHQIDYNQIEDANVRADISLPLERRGIAHGLAIWFDSELLEGISLSNAPAGEELIYGNAFFPFQLPVEVTAGDQVAAKFEGYLIGDDYVWRWDTRVTSQGTMKASFKQSTVFGTPLSPAQLHKRAASYVPVPNEDGRIEAFVLSQMDGKNSLEQIAAELVERFPLRFHDANDALDLAAELSVNFSK